MNKTIPMEYRYFKHETYTNKHFLDLIVWYPNGISHFKINDKGVIELHTSGLTENPLKNQEPDYYYLDHCSLEMLQTMEPLRMKFDLDSIIKNFVFLREYFSLTDTELKDISMEHVNILSEGSSYLSQIAIFLDDLKYSGLQKDLDEFMDVYFINATFELSPPIKEQMKDEFNKFIREFSNLNNNQ